MTKTWGGGWRAAVAAWLLASLAGGCGGGDDGGGTPPTDDLEFEHYSAGFFSLDKPKGWQVTTAGSCGTFAFVIRDPQEPLRRIFYFGTVGPVYLCQEQKDLDAWYVDHGGFPNSWLDAPVVDPFTPENYLAHWPGIADMAAATAFMADFPQLDGLQLVATAPQASLLPGGASANARGVFVQDDRVAEGMFLATVVTFFPYTGVPGGGIGNGNFICGVTAPHGEFAGIVQRLISSLDSFTITQGYVDDCLALSQLQWGAVAEAGRTLSEASDIIWEGWQARSHSQDISAEQWTDSFREVERVYDPSTGEVYEVPNGWYATYDADRAAWDMSGLQPLPADGWELWMRAVLDGQTHIH